MPRTDPAYGHTKEYVSRQVFAARVQLSIPHAAHLVREGRAPTPDILIAPKHKGWNEERLHSYGLDAGIVDEDGAKLGPPTGGSNLRRTDLRALVSAFYSGPPALYLGPSLVAAMWGVPSETLFTQRWRHKDFPADVTTLGKKAGRFGWAEENALRAGKQSRGLTEQDVDRWAIGRTEDHGLPVADWVLQRAKERETVGEWLAGHSREWLEDNSGPRADFWQPWQPTMTPEEIDTWCTLRTMLHHQPIPDWVRRWAETRPEVADWLTEWEAFVGAQPGQNSTRVVSHREIDAWLLERAESGEPLGGWARAYAEKRPTLKRLR